MRRKALLSLAGAALLVGAGSASAEERYYTYDPVSASARLMTRGVTLQVERGLFGAVRVERLFATAGQGSAGLSRGGLSDSELRGALPQGAREVNVYRIEAEEAQGAALGRALCPGASEVWLVFGRVRPLRDLTIHAVGRGSAGAVLHCMTLQYQYRGEWERPSGAPGGPSVGAPPPRL